MIEFDVLSERPDGSGSLLVAHDYGAARAPGVLTWSRRWRTWRARRTAAVELDVDLKLPGYELTVLRALREHGLLERRWSARCTRDSLERLRAVEPGLRLGWSVPRVKRDYTTDSFTAVPALAVLSGYRAWLPRARAPRAGAAALRRVDGPLASGDAAAGGGRGCRPAASSTCGRSTTACGSPACSAWGSTAIITNDPRLFDAAAAAARCSSAARRACSPRPCAVAGRRPAPVGCGASVTFAGERTTRLPRCATGSRSCRAARNAGR